MLRRVVPALGGLLVLFHAWLLGSQLWDGQLAEPGLILRWAIAAGLVGALVGLRRSGASLLWGRKAVSIWLLAALLHGPAMAGDHSPFDSPALPEAVTALVQIAAASTMAGLGLLLLAGLAARLWGRPHVRLRTVPVRSHRALRSYPVHRFAPRPPPARSISAR
jgi:hypothetical protein